MRKSRKRKGFSVTSAAGQLNISKSYISMLESGDNKPNWQLLANLAQLYQVSADYLLGIVDDPEGRRELSPEVLEILRFWRMLDADQRRLVMDTMKMFARVRTPHIIRGKEEET